MGRRVLVRENVVDRPKRAIASKSRVVLHEIDVIAHSL